jgi:hypothetical protein
MKTLVVMIPLTGHARSILADVLHTLANDCAVNTKTFHVGDREAVTDRFGAKYGVYGVVDIDSPSNALTELQ